MSASTGDWWHNAVTAAAAAIERTDWLMHEAPSVDDRRVADAVLAAALPLFVAEATRRIKTTAFTVEYAEEILAGLAGEVGQ